MKNQAIHWNRYVLVWLCISVSALSLHAQKQAVDLPGLSILMYKNKLTPPNTKLAFSNKMTMQQGFICLWENKMERSAHLPLRFRLGCVEAVDRMEGKRRDWLHP